MDIRNFALSLISNDPKFSNNPMAQNYISIIQSNDQQQGSLVAKNLCESFGMTPEQAYIQAKQFFGIPS